MSSPQMLNDLVDNSMTPSSTTEIDKLMKLVGNYGTTLKEKIEYEKKNKLLEILNKSQAGRIEDLENELKETKTLLQLSETTGEELQKQLRELKIIKIHEEDKQKNVVKVREEMIADLREDLAQMKKKLCSTTGSLTKTLCDLEKQRERCKEYKDKVRGFALLFTYFNDPQRNSREDLLTVQETTSSTLWTSMGGLNKSKSSNVQLALARSVTDTFKNTEK